MLRSIPVILVGFLMLGSVSPAWAADYEVGPGQPLTTIGEVPWESLMPGDRVLIHWQAAPYTEKWVICRQGTEANPIVVSGVPGPSGQLPVIDGRNAVTRTELNFWNEGRGVIKIGGANSPPDTLPAHIIIENLEIRSGRPPYGFTDTDGQSASYQNNAAAIYVEKATDLIIRNCILRDSGNGLFIGAYDGETEDILIEGNWIYDNGIEGSIYEHNTYTAAI
ncbi:MAG: right-handed parallel beta-helix repeat-containing protein, partial [Acidobacteria bacterium]